MTDVATTPRTSGARRAASSQPGAPRRRRSHRPERPGSALREPSADARRREELIHGMLPLAKRLASRYRHSGESLDDLEQVAYLGLVKAADRYDPAAGAFVSYATPTILGELRRHFRDKGWGVHVTRTVQENCLRINDATERLYATLGRPPSAREIAAETGLAVEDTIEALSAATSYTPAALDGPAPGDTSDEGCCLGDSLGTVDPGFEHAELRASIGPAFQALPRRDQRILHLRFVKDLTQSEIAAEIGISQMHVSRLLRQALDHLQAAAGPAPGDAA